VAFPQVRERVSPAGHGASAPGPPWRSLREYEGVDHVIACKILARPRPELIPVRDSVTELVLGLDADDNDWLLLGRALSD
jgi:Family of unknown function (DUF6308)